MNRLQFEAIRNVPGKHIRGDIRFAKRAATSPALVADGIVIESDGSIELRLSISFNPQVGSKTFNVHVPGVGPICRLDVDGPAHRPAGRSHNHSLQNDHCPDNNLPDGVVDNPTLAGKSVRDLFATFCAMAHIVHTGTLHTPDGS